MPVQDTARGRSMPLADRQLLDNAREIERALQARRDRAAAEAVRQIPPDAGRRP